MIIIKKNSGNLTYEATIPSRFATTLYQLHKAVDTCNLLFGFQGYALKWNNLHVK